MWSLWTCTLSDKINLDNRQCRRVNWNGTNGHLQFQMIKHLLLDLPLERCFHTVKHVIASVNNENVDSLPLVWDVADNKNTQIPRQLAQIRTATNNRAILLVEQEKCTHKNVSESLLPFIIFYGKIMANDAKLSEFF